MTDWTPISPGDPSWVPAVVETANTSAAESAAAAAASEAVATAKATAAASSASDAQGYASDAAATLAGAVKRDGTNTPTANLPMDGFRHTGVGAATTRTQYVDVAGLQDGKYLWADGGGTADAITATYAPALTALVDGQLCFVRATAANATTTPTFSPNGVAAHTITKSGGGALVAGDIAGDGHELILRYNLAGTRWELLNPARPKSATSLTAFGDSITFGSNADTGLGYIYLLGNRLGLTPTVNAVPGNCLADQQQFIFKESISAATTPIYTLMIGTNDLATHGAGDDDVANFKTMLRAACVWLTASEASKTRFIDDGVEYTGTWTTGAISFDGRTIGKKSTTNGSTAQAVVNGDTVYVGYGIKDGSGGTFNLTIDSVSYGTFACKGAGSTDIDTTRTGITFTPVDFGIACARITGLPKGDHVVTLTVTSTTDTANAVEPQFIRGNGAADFFDGPELWLGDVPRQASGGESDADVLKYTNAVREVVAELQGDGINIRNAKTFGHLDPVAGISDSTYHVHPNNLGHSQLYDAFSACIGADRHAIRSAWASSFFRVGANSSLELASPYGFQVPSSDAYEAFPTPTLALHPEEINSVYLGGSDKGVLLLSGGGQTDVAQRMTLGLKGYGTTDGPQARFYGGTARVATIMGTGYAGFGSGHSDPVYAMDVLLPNSSTGYVCARQNDDGQFATAGFLMVGPSDLGDLRGARLVQTIIDTGHSRVQTGLDRVKADGTYKDTILSHDSGAARWVISPDGTDTLYVNTAAVLPVTDNAIALGGSSNRFSEAFIATATINTSGRKTKTNIEPVEGPLLEVAKGLVGLVRTYQFNDAVARKGDKARRHVGWIYEDVVELFKRHGLDPFKYGAVCSDPKTERVKKTYMRREQATEAKTVEIRKVETVDGKAVLKITHEIQEVPAFDMVPLFDEAGKPVMEDVFQEDMVNMSLRADGKPALIKIGERQVMHRQPRMIEVPHDIWEDVEVPGEYIVGLRYDHLEILAAVGAAALAKAA